MRASDIILETIEIISEKTSADELLTFLKPLGFKIQKQSGTTVKILVPRSLRSTAVQQISNTLPDSKISVDGKVVQYDGASILVKPEEAQHGGRAVEQGQIDELGKLITANLNGKPYILLVVGGRTVRAAGTNKAPEGVKADTVIVDNDGNPVAWISLKDGRAPRDIVLWGGISHQPMVSHPEIQQFIQDAKAAFPAPEGIPKGSTYGRLVQDPQLKTWGTFGKEFGNNPGQSNVDLILQGTPKFVKSKGGFVLTGEKTWSNGEIPGDAYDPVLMISHRSDRSNFNIPNARVFLAPAKARPYKELPSAPVVTKQPVQPPGLANKQKPMATSQVPMAQPKPTKPIVPVAPGITNQ
jgi:hypothetical protein